MKDFKADFKTIYQNERIILAFMVINFLAALALVIFCLTGLNPNAAVVQIGYGDIGGYRDGTWVDLLAFPLLAVIFGVLHSLLTVRIFHKRGSGMAKFFLLTTTFLILGTFLVLIRILGEG